MAVLSGIVTSETKAELSQPTAVLPPVPDEVVGAPSVVWKSVAVTKGVFVSDGVSVITVGVAVGEAARAVNCPAVTVSAALVCAAVIASSSALALLKETINVMMPARINTPTAIHRPRLFGLVVFGLSIV